MEIIVTVTKINDVQEFPSRKNDGVVYKKYSFVGKTNEQYAKTICFSCGKDDWWKKFNIKVGEQYKVYFDVVSREWNGKWFTEVNTWRVIQLSGIQPQQTSAVPNGQPYTEPPKQEQANGGDEQLPF